MTFCRLLPFKTIPLACSETIHTYIIGHYNPSVRIIDLVSHTTYVVCVVLWRDLQFKVDSERQIFWEIFHGNFNYSQSFCQKSAERKSPKKYFLYFVLMSGLANPGFSSNKPTHYLLDHGDIQTIFIIIKIMVIDYVAVTDLWQSYDYLNLQKSSKEHWNSLFFLSNRKIFIKYAHIQTNLLFYSNLGIWILFI